MRPFARLLALLFTLFSVTAAAQATVGVDPVARLYTAAPGQTITQVLSIYNPNPNKQKLRVVAYLTDMNISETGETEFPPAGTVKESSASWITFTPAEIELGGEESKQVRYTIQVPADATPGTHWAMLMFEGQEPAAIPGKTLASFRLRVAHTIYVNVQPTKAEGSITGIFDALPQTETGPYQIAVQYSNSGNVVTGVQGRVELRDASGNLAATLPLDLIVALPNRSVLLKSSWVGPVPKGQYSALVVLNNGDKGKDILGEHVVNLPFDLKLPAATAGATPSGTAPATTPPSNPAGKP
ncbi:hypothetical protein [Deinococcus humi]|uniref:P pilus assembly protein, chaperone PapD n=1 Tax=Deinococcus humi TaxID=662880 RepID=A0A7W8JU67_9DEIO|nr:hypothetical protein [Deinococcus humi]MBB5362873.1 hypothetical protein [Deinococcus humi]GGO25876.1 hypothetical protein GCM10008949_16090 [Deinococcus humi]